MNFQVSGKEYMDLLALKRTVEAVVKTYNSQRQFISTPGCDSLINALTKGLTPLNESASEVSDG
jgi:hypothetical protein